MEKKVVGALAGAGFLLNAFAFRLPVVQDVDVVVAGGSSAAVAAAVAAKQAGATVFLAAPRPYLGEDLAGTLHLARVPDDDESHPIYRARRRVASDLPRDFRRTPRRAGELAVRLHLRREARQAAW